MGVDAADYDHTGRASIVISNFSNQMISLYHNEGNGLFVDEAPRSNLGRLSLLTLGFSCFFYDYDLDGWQDIFVANGHIEPEIERVQKRITYRQPPHLFRNLGNGKFVEMAGKMGETFDTPRVARGAAYADIDNDGDLDLLITTNGGPALLYRNDGVTGNSLRIRLLGSQSNRDGIGAMVRVACGPNSQWQMLKTGGYLSSNELVLTFGMGSEKRASTVEVTWPSGKVDRLSNIDAGQTITIQEGKGLAGAKKFEKPS
jgi:hypothetical protein